MDATLELEIGPGPEPGSYVVQVLRSAGGGEPHEVITLDIHDLVERLPLLEASVLGSGRPARRVIPDALAGIQQAGSWLFRSVFVGEVGTAYRTSYLVASELGKELQLLLSLKAFELSALPWEAMYDDETHTYVCRKETLVRLVPTPYIPAALAITTPVRVLAVISSPRGLPVLDVEGERERLQRALLPNLRSGLIELDWLADASWARLHDRLLDGTCHVLHFIGHSAFDVHTDDGVLAFIGGDDHADYVAATSLADLLNEAEPTPRLVVLNSPGAASGTGAALVRSGIRAAVAMQFSMTDEASAAFAGGFYTALALGRSIDEAVRSGRIGILRLHPGTLEWVTPVLYLRGEDTRLFETAAVDSERADVEQVGMAGDASSPAPHREPEPVRPAPPRWTFSGHEFLDFDLLIEKGTERAYSARVVRAPAGEAGPVALDAPFSELELENFLLKIGRPRRGLRRGLETPEAQAVRAFGTRLFQAVFDGDIRIDLASSLQDAEAQGKGLRIRIRLADAPALADLPWEYLYDPSAAHFLALSSWTPVVRYLDLPGKSRPTPVRPPLKILVMAANPPDHDPLDVAAEVGKLREGLEGLESQGLVAIDVLEKATLRALRRRLRREDYHVFHFIGHGGYSSAAEDGVLIFEDVRGGAYPGRLVSGSDLGVALHDKRTLRLVVLNSCEGARGGLTDPYAGTAQGLIRQGIPAVIAMQFEITDDAAITFSHNFYEAVADGYPLDAAVAESRKAIHSDENGVEWGTPVLYLRAPDGRIFEVASDTSDGDSDRHA